MMWTKPKIEPRSLQKREHFAVKYRMTMISIIASFDKGIRNAPIFGGGGAK